MKNISSTNERLNHLGKIVFVSALTVHQEMGPGLLETVYQQCMISELRERGIGVGSLVPVPLFYKGTQLKKDYVIDIPSS